MAAGPAKPNLYVMCRFLDRLAEGPASRSRLQLAVRLNYDLFCHYLSLLEGRGYIETKDDALALSAKGQDARSRLAGIVAEWLDGPKTSDSPRPVPAAEGNGATD